LVFPVTAMKRDDGHPAEAPSGFLSSWHRSPILGITIAKIGMKTLKQ
jgi:hypothetical protein